MLNTPSAVLMAAYHRLIWALAVLSAVLLTLMTAGIAAEAVMRSLRLGLVYGIVDFAEHVMFCLAVRPAPWILSRNGHITVDLLITNVSRGTARTIAALTDLTGLAVSASIAWYGIGILRQSILRGEYIIQELVIPEWWLQWQVPLVFLLLTIEFALRLARHVQPSAPRTGQ